MISVKSVVQIHLGPILFPSALFKFALLACFWAVACCPLLPSCPSKGQPMGRVSPCPEDRQREKRVHPRMCCPPKRVGPTGAKGMIVAPLWGATTGRASASQQEHFCPSHWGRRLLRSRKRGERGETKKYELKPHHRHVIFWR